MLHKAQLSRLGRPKREVSTFHTQWTTRKKKRLSFLLCPLPQLNKGYKDLGTRREWRSEDGRAKTTSLVLLLWTPVSSSCFIWFETQPWTFHSIIVPSCNKSAHSVKGWVNDRLYPKNQEVVCIKDYHKQFSIQIMVREKVIFYQPTFPKNFHNNFKFGAAKKNHAFPQEHTTITSLILMECDITSALTGHPAVIKENLNHLRSGQSQTLSFSSVNLYRLVFLEFSIQNWVMFSSCMECYHLPSESRITCKATRITSK